MYPTALLPETAAALARLISCPTPARWRTPGAIIGKQLIVGAQGYDQFKADIDAALGSK